MSNLPPQPERVYPFSGLIAALRFLTILPVPGPAELPLSAYGSAVGWYPAVGALIGSLLIGGSGLLRLVFPPALGAALTLGLWVLLTAALHLDGFLDTCDGLLGGITPDQRLEIMHDERVGAYALAGGSLLLIGKFGALLAISDWRALLLAPVLGRGVLSLAVISCPYARPQGLGKLAKSAAGPQQLMLSGALTLAAVLVGWSWQAGAALLVAGISLFSITSFTLRRIPGLTGDVYGAVVELVELAVLLVYSLQVPVV